MELIRLYMVEDQPAILKAQEKVLSHFEDLKLVGSAMSGEDALADDALPTGKDRQLVRFHPCTLIVAQVGAPGNAFWRTISRDNVTTWYGRSADSRIADPADPAPTLGRSTGCHRAQRGRRCSRPRSSRLPVRTCRSA
jgi:hypothetical protein